MAETSTFFTWAQMLMYVEDRLGIASPGISDEQALDSKQVSELALRDFMCLVREYAVTEGETVDLVLVAGREVMRTQVSEADMNRPICAILEAQLRRPSEEPPL